MGSRFCPNMVKKDHTVSGASSAREENPKKSNRATKQKVALLSYNVDWTDGQVDVTKPKRGFHGFGG